MENEINYGTEKTFFILNKINNLIKITPEGNLLIYKIVDFFNKNDYRKKINPLKEDEILYDLEKWGTLKIKNRERIDDEMIYYLEILLKFEKTYLDHESTIAKNKKFVESTKNLKHIRKIEIVKHEANTNKINIIINNNYKSPLKIKCGPYWSMLYKLAKDGQIVNSHKNKGFFDYFNSNLKNPLYSTLKYSKTKILKHDGAACILGEISIELISSKKLSQRKNK